MKKKLKPKVIRKGNKLRLVCFIRRKHEYRTIGGWVAKCKICQQEFGEWT